MPAPAAPTTAPPIPLVELDPATRRLSYLPGVLAFGFLAGIALSWKLWLSERFYPMSPVWSRLPNISHPWDYVWLGAIVLLLAGIILHRRPRWFLVAFVVTIGALGLWDQSRWQPWVYQYAFMCVALSCYPWRQPELSPAQAQAALNACRIIVAGTYFWSGLQKLNPNFVDDVFPWLMEPLTTRLPVPMQSKINALAIAVPIVESALGLGLLFRRTRPFAAIGVAAMHLFLLLSLGPLGHNWNTVVWPWNLTMALVTLILFWGTKSVSFANIIRPRRSACHALTLLLFGIMPALNFVGRWDSYLSAALYSGNTMQGTLFISDGVYDQLPPPVQKQFAWTPEGGYRVDIRDWSTAELNVPANPARRVFRSVARSFRKYATQPKDVILTIQERPLGWTKERRETRYDATELE